MSVQCESFTWDQRCARVLFILLRVSTDRTGNQDVRCFSSCPSSSNHSLAYRFECSTAADDKPVIFSTAGFAASSKFSTCAARWHDHILRIIIPDEFHKYKFRAFRTSNVYDIVVRTPLCNSFFTRGARSNGTKMTFSSDVVYCYFFLLRVFHWLCLLARVNA